MWSAAEWPAKLKRIRLAKSTRGQQTPLPGIGLKLKSIFCRFTLSYFKFTSSINLR